MRQSARVSEVSDRVVDTASDGNESETDLRGLRSVAQLNTLHSLAATLNSLGAIEEIANAITAELRTIIDYHNCRVYVLQEDGLTLRPIAFRGDLFSEYERETYDELVTVIGEGITGHVAQARESLLTPDANEVPFSVVIPGTDDDLLESMLAVPMLAGDDVVGVIVLSSLGYGMFDEIDRRLLEVLASHAGVAFQNATLLAATRESARASGTLLQLSQTLTSKRTLGDIFQAAIETIPSIVASRAVAAYVQDRETGGFKAARLHAVEGVQLRPRASIADVPREVADAFLTAGEEPLVVTREVALQVPKELWILDELSDVLVTPLRWDPDGFGAIIVVGELDSSGFGEREIRVSRGIADIT